jgi:hypothetical protein
MNEATRHARGITDRLASLRTAADAARCGVLSPEATTAALVAADELIAVLGLLAFPVTEDDDERLEQVVVTVHSVDVSVRGRRDDVFVHIEDQRDDEDRAAWPLVVAVNEAGEVGYADG